MYKTKLSSFISEYGDGIHGTPIYSNKGEYYFINGNNLEDGFIVINDDTLKVDSEQYEKIRRPLNDRTVLLSINGTLGKTAFYRGEKIALGKSACYINIKSDHNKEFFRYILTTKEFQKYMLLVAHGSTIKNFAPSQVGEYEVELPDVNEHESIANLLSSLDAKISNNKAICSDLEAMAKLLYDYWFVQFDFPDENGKPYKSSGGKMVWNEELKREIPDGWEVKPLSDIFSITMGSSPSGASLNENGEGIEFYQGSTDFGDLYPTKRVYTTAPVRFAKAQDMLLSVRAPVGDMNIAMNDCCIGRGLAAIHHTCTLYAWCSMFSLRPYFDIYNGNGTTFGALTSDDLKGKLTVCPKESVLNSFTEKVNPISQELRLLSKETQQLTSLRNFLLPMLMNGQVKVKKGESQ